MNATLRLPKTTSVFLRAELDSLSISSFFVAHGNERRLGPWMRSYALNPRNDNFEPRFHLSATRSFLGFGLALHFAQGEIMSQLHSSPRRRTPVRLLSGYSRVLAAFLLTLVAPGTFAQVTHVSNPYAGATVYASPDYVTEVNTAIAAEPAGSTLANQMAVVGNTPTFHLAGPHRGNCGRLSE